MLEAEEQLEEQYKEVRASKGAQASATSDLEEAQAELRQLRQRLHKLEGDGGPDAVREAQAEVRQLRQRLHKVEGEGGREAVREARSAAEAVRRELQTVAVQRDKAVRAAQAAEEAAASAAEDAAAAVRGADERAAAAQAEVEEEAEARRELQRRAEEAEDAAAQAQEDAVRARTAAAAAERKLADVTVARRAPASMAVRRGGGDVHAAAMEVRRADERLSRAFEDVQRLREVAESQGAVGGLVEQGGDADTRQAMARLERRVSALEQERRDAAARLEAVRGSVQPGGGGKDGHGELVRGHEDETRLDEVPEGSVASEGGVWEGGRGVEALVAAMENEVAGAGGRSPGHGPDSRRWLRHVAVAVQRRMLAAGAVARDARAAAAAARARADALSARLRTAGFESDGVELALQAQDSAAAAVADSRSGDGASDRAEAAAAWAEVARLQAALRDAEERLEEQAVELQRLRAIARAACGGGAGQAALPGFGCAAVHGSEVVGTLRAGATADGPSAEAAEPAMPSWNSGSRGIAELRSPESACDKSIAMRSSSLYGGLPSPVATSAFFAAELREHAASLRPASEHGAPGDAEAVEGDRGAQPSVDRSNAGAVPGIDGGGDARAAAAVRDGSARDVCSGDTPALRMSVSAVARADSVVSSTNFDTARSRPADSDMRVADRGVGHLHVSADSGKSGTAAVRNPMLESTEGTGAGEGAGAGLMRGYDADAGDALASPLLAQRMSSMHRYNPDDIDSPLVCAGACADHAVSAEAHVPPVSASSRGSSGSGSEHTAAGGTAHHPPVAAVADSAAAVSDSAGGGKAHVPAEGRCGEERGGRGSPESDVSLAELARETHSRLQQIAAANDRAAADGAVLLQEGGTGAGELHAGTASSRALPGDGSAGHAGNGMDCAGGPSASPLAVVAGGSGRGDGGMSNEDAMARDGQQVWRWCPCASCCISHWNSITPVRPGRLSLAWLPGGCSTLTM